MKKGSLHEKPGEMVIMRYCQGTNPETVVAIKMTSVLIIIISLQVFT